MTLFDTSHIGRKHPKDAQRKAFPKFRSMMAEIRFKAKIIMTLFPCVVQTRYNM